MGMTKDLPDSRDRIITYSFSVFARYGFSKVSIEEIVSDLHISKTTFYRFFKSKEDLLGDVISEQFSQLNDEIKSIIAGDSRDYLEQLKQVLHAISGRLSSIEPTLIQDIKSSVPWLWEKTQKLLDDIVYSTVGKLILKGKKEKLVRSDMDPVLVANLMVVMVRSITQIQSDNSFPYPLKETIQTGVEIMINGIART